MNMNLKILDLIKKRLIKGEKKYGKENIASDDRDFIQESLEEALDCAVYLAAILIELDEKEKQNNSWYKANITVNAMDIR